MNKTDIPKNYADRVRKIRGDLRQEDLAHRLGVSFVTVNRWENNWHKPSRLAWKQLLEFEKKRKPRKNTENP